MKKEIENELIAWIKDSEDTNSFCERSILVDAIKLLSQDNPNVDGALSRLFELTPVDGNKFVCPPYFAIEIENGKL
jgi:hypothetical protein